MPQTLSTGIPIVGDGIADLWLNARLRRAGYAIVLVESVGLGGGQSMKSQGVIHSGVKYVLYDVLIGAFEVIADMPRRRCARLGNDGGLDLQGVRLPSEMYHPWLPGDLADSLTNFFISKAMRSQVEQAKGEDLPSALRDKESGGETHRLTEVVFDVPDLIRRLTELTDDSLLAGERIEPLREGRELAGLCVDGREIRVQRAVLNASTGNEALLRELDLEQPAMQRQPLYMAIVKAVTLKPPYAHYLGTGSRPQITVATHPTRNGQSVWYLGGGIAETDGVARDEAAQIAEVRHELAKLLPWINLGQAQWVILRADRAEPAQPNLLRPDNVSLAKQGRLLIGWPTKLALISGFADRACARLEGDDIRLSEHAALLQLPRPSLAEPV